MLPFGQEGVADSLCNPTDTVCVEPQPHESNFTESYNHQITNAVLDPKTGVSISYDVVNLVPIA
eukprot:CAMPEP_0184289758 /NCGR_PEP_ID=MMETSP1049-20130417/2127_1 /TAXON_ID=77928 /ORGANISM="Proteomonas sulcata, Strain CCMP704" /LENGTH=63 /DNA_ID=CAMNT_0026596661 /DNA_START=74 /DNA_END=265 /DNA_ORIENTATION=+